MPRLIDPIQMYIVIAMGFMVSLRQSARAAHAKFLLSS